MYEIVVLLLCHSDEMISPTYEIRTKNSGCHTGERVSPMYEIPIVVMSYG